MILHNLLRTHVPDPSGNHWDNGLFLSACAVCGRAMVKPVGGKWQIVPGK